MSDTPSWLTEENIAVASSAAKNPAVQKAAVAAASNPVVQKAAVDAAKNPAVQKAAINAAAPGWGDSYQPPAPPGDVEAQTAEPVRSDLPPLDIDPAELKEMQKYAMGLKLYYMGCAILMSAAAWVYILGGGSDFNKFFIAFYVFFFAILICCMELALTACARLIASNFGFLYNGIGRGVFLVFIAALSFNLGDIGIAAMAMLLLGVILNIVIVFQFPKYTLWLRRKHFETFKK